MEKYVHPGIVKAKANELYMFDALSNCHLLFNLTISVSYNMLLVLHFRLSIAQIFLNRFAKHSSVPKFSTEQYNPLSDSNIGIIIPTESPIPEVTCPTAPSQVCYSFLALLVVNYTARNMVVDTSFPNVSTASGH